MTKKSSLLDFSASYVKAALVNNERIINIKRYTSLGASINLEIDMK